MRFKKNVRSGPFSKSTRFCDHQKQNLQSKNKDSRPIWPIPYLLNVLDATSSNQDRVPGFALHEAVVWHPAERNLRHCQIVLLRNILNKLECLEIGLVPVPSGSSQMNVKESCDRTETIQGLTERDNSAENMER